MERPKYDKITREIVSKLSDKDLEWAAWEYFWFEVENSYNHNANAALAAMPPGFQVIYHLSVLNGEIANGGFNQYFFNGLNEQAEQQSESLNSVGAVDHLKIFQNAFAIYEKEQSDQELQRLYKERTLESFSKTYKRTSLDECDSEWYAMEAELQNLIGRFIRQHIELFVGTE